MHLFGLTGGIASGKTTVARVFRRAGLPVIDADELAREVVALGTDGHREVIARFGDRVRADSGEIDRKALGRIVFSDRDSRAALNAIVHPRIAHLARARAAELAAQGEPLACYEAALLVENSAADQYRPLVVVACPEPVQVARLVARDGLSPAGALARIHAQLPLADKVKAADYVVDTALPPLACEARARAVLAAVAAKLGVAPSRYGVSP